MEGSRHRRSWALLHAPGELPHVAPDQACGRPPAAADIRDVDGLEDDRTATVSVFNGPPPEVLIAASEVEEVEKVADFIQGARADGIEPAAIGLFVRSRNELPRARAAAVKAGIEATELTGRSDGGAGRIAIGTMHFAKGLEFRAVAVMACDEAVIPAAARIADVSDEMELDEVYATERQLLYVAATRAPATGCSSVALHQVRRLSGGPAGRRTLRASAHASAIRMRIK